ncbi:trehalose-phosphatase [Methylocella sp.]|uniref:trehalose-phosphatase n=1 Tax=Methylocella sp. TaxID=1978226 RepID=UPI0037849F70
MERPPILLRPGEVADRAPPGRSAYFLDVDGTLLDIAPRPEDVRADPGLRTLIETLAREAGGALALVSGRAIDDLDRIFAPLVLPAAGLHGAEIRFFDGTREAAAEVIADFARARLRVFAAAHPGLRVEDKGAAIALHYRQRPDLAAEALAFMEALADGPDLVVQPGKMVAELKQAGHSKATGIAALMAQAPCAGRAPLFAGDDLTDEAGFCYVDAHGGVSVKIGGPDVVTRARFRLESPQALRAELAVAAHPAAKPEAPAAPSKN